MARSLYQYGTTPRKLNPDYNKPEKKKRRQLRILENEPNKKPTKKVSKRKNQKTAIIVAISMFLVLLAISCRNSQIDKKFNQIQDQKKELAAIQKENEQLKISIENSMNLSNIEKVAKEELGMQKLSSSQTIYVSLPKKDYVEANSEKVVIEKEEGFLDKIINKILNKK